LQALNLEPAIRWLTLVRMKNIKKTAAFLLLVLACLSCQTYGRFAMPASRLKKIDTSGMTLFVIDENGTDKRVWYASNSVWEGSTLSCDLERLAEPDAVLMRRKHTYQSAEEAKDEVLIFVVPKAAEQFQDQGRVTISMEQMSMVEVSEVDSSRPLRNALYLIGGLGLLILVANI
jgi:hypothetical protein